MAAGRREHTTDLIRAAARAEFTAVGPRALSLNAVAKRAFVSVGSVYERYDNKEDCIADLVHELLPFAVDDVGAGWIDPSKDVGALIRDDLMKSSQLEDLRFIAECVFAARDDEGLRPGVVKELERLLAQFASRPIIVGGESGTAWWTLSTWLGYALLTTSGCTVPRSFIGQTTGLLSAIGSYVEGVSLIEVTVQGGDSAFSVQPRQDASDDTTRALLDATRHVILQQGVDEADTRTIASAAGVTTGAIYRRFNSRSQILARAFLAELPPERYAWTEPLLTALDNQGLDGAAKFFVGLLRRIWEDEFSARMLLEFTIAAHTDDEVLHTILTEIQKVADGREELFIKLQEAGIVREDVSPEALSWLLQIPPIGMRLLASIRIVPSQTDLLLLMHAYLLYLTDTGEQDG